MLIQLSLGALLQNLDPPTVADQSSFETHYSMNKRSFTTLKALLHILDWVKSSYLKLNWAEEKLPNIFGFIDWRDIVFGTFKLFWQTCIQVLEISMFCMYIPKFNLVYRVILHGWKYVYSDPCFHLTFHILYNTYMNNIYNYQSGTGTFFLSGSVHLLVGVW